MDKDKKDNKQVSLSEASAMADTVAKVELAMTDEIRLAHEMYGRTQMSAGLAKLSTVAHLLEVQRFKDSKVYKHLPNPESSDAVPFSRWDDFCRVILGKSSRAIDEELQNLTIFGQEAIESMNTIGLGVRQLRQLRKLPDDQIEQAKLLAKEKDVDSLKDLIEEQAVEKSKLKEALEKTEKDKKEEAEASGNLLQKKSQELDKLRTKLEKRAIQLDDWDAMVNEMDIAIAVQGGKVMQDLDNLDLLLDKLLHMELPDDQREACEERMATNYIAVMKSATIKIDEMMNKTVGTIGAYEDRAIPLLDRYIKEQSGQSV